MIRALGMAAALLALAACAEVQRATDNVARQGARAAIDEVLVTRFPGVDGNRVTPYTDCVIDNASGREIARLAQAALIGVDEDTVTLVFDITKRPETARCLLQTGLGLAT
ncbi:hypothetical protein AIOL_003222 [Candidatus Rhodobacter oscarellae]|uniref:Succinate dehydrogenase n=1 Tax=Candidatus Rhodobacter oscarellae TaxID=1675527 RepID=A0A0J9E6F6_9RHOB|nr:hypothetical protein [Candidatus Rhodobacter lobularis]KMW58251.1 hypothetical protein AIOL_003222 [Candidatus Rhodobacter lobularis]